MGENGHAGTYSSYTAPVPVYQATLPMVFDAPCIHGPHHGAVLVDGYLRALQIQGRVAGVEAGFIDKSWKPSKPNKQYAAFLRRRRQLPELKRPSVRASNAQTRKRNLTSITCFISPSVRMHAISMIVSFSTSRPVVRHAKSKVMV